MMLINPKLQFLLDNFFVSFNQQTLFCQVADINGRLIFLNDYFKQQKSIINRDNAIGMTITDFISKNGYAYYHGYTEDLDALYQEVISNRQRKSFFAYARDLNGHDYIRLANVFPLLAADGELLGTYTLSWYANPFNFLLCFQNNFIAAEAPPAETPQLAIKLTRREHQVLFLLIHNFSQYEIAKFLMIARATVQKIINDKLCTKFEINPPNSNQLIAHAQRLNLHMYFPPSLLGARMVELKNDENILQAIAATIKTSAA